VTTYEAYYGCDEKCDPDNKYNINASITQGLAYELAGAPSWENLTSTLPVIDCYDEAYRYTTGYKNSGSATAMDAGIRIGVSSSGSSFGSVGNVAGYIVEGSIQYRIRNSDGEPWGSWVPTTFVAGSDQRFTNGGVGITNEIHTADVAIPDLPPGASVEISYEVFYKDPTVACNEINSSIIMPVV